ncbi:MAG: aspartate racemase [Deltaproteobacteria bacterium]|nr:MAG: aspartate racemase [Deltaproteobacteria bacterium]
MRVIGLLGGTSWPSTIEYYRTLNKMVQSRLGGFHSANLLLRSIDYHEIKSRYSDRWDEIPLLLETALRDLDSRGPDCILICNNMLHKAYDLVASNLNLQAPVIHIVETVGRAAFFNEFKRLLLLGTKFTMEDGFYAKCLKRFGCDVIVPALSERDRIQEIQSQLASGFMEEIYRDYFRNLLAHYSDTEVDAVILGCTELPLAIGSADASKPLLNPIELQCAEALDFVFESKKV